MLSQHFSFVFTLLIASLLTACATTPASEPITANRKFEQFLADEWEYAMIEYPVFATAQGYPGQDDRWTDNSLEAQTSREQRQFDVLARLKKINYAKLSKANQLNYRLYKDSLERDIEGQQFDDKYLVINHLGGVYSSLAQLAAWVPLRTVADYNHFIARMRGVPTQVENTIINLRLGLEKKVTPPRRLLEKVPALIKKQLDAENHPVLTVLARMPESFSDADKQRITAQIKTTLTDEVIPAYQKLYDFVHEQYIPESRTEVAWRALPKGKQWYAHKVKGQTTTDLTPEAIHQLGLSEVDRLQSEIKKVMQEVNFDGDLKAFFEYTQTDQQFRFKSKKELLQAYRALAKTIDYQLLKVVSQTPRLPYGVEPVPEYREQTAPTAYFRNGNLQAGTPSTFFVNTYNLPTRYRWELQPLTLHETVPGHHLQLALAAEQGELPKFRQHASYTAYVEGWGLYAETLGYEMGFYQTPYTRYGQLSYELWRAARLVVDTGLHYYGWSRKKAIAYLVNHAGRSRHDAEVEVDRYIVWPGQALAYKIGQLKIKALRTHCEKVQGEQFDLRQFHDQILANGALPLNILEEMSRAYCAEK